MPSLLDLGADTSATAHPSLTPVPSTPTDPSIIMNSLGAKPGSGIQLQSDLQDLQAKMNQNKLFQQTYGARVKAGQILASSPDLETGLGNLYKDPQVAPFAGEIVSSIRQGMLAQTQNAGEQQKQAESGFEAFKKVLPALAADPSPSTWKSVTDPVLATLSPSARKSVSSAMDSLRESLVDGLPDDPAAAQQQFRSRVAGLAAANPEVWGLMFGKPGQVDLGGSIQPTMTNPSTGAVSPAGVAFPKSLAPQTVTGPYGPGGATETTVLGGGNALGGGGPAGTGGGVPHPLHAPNAPSDSGAPIPPTTTPGYHFGPGNALIGPSQTDAEYNTSRTKDMVDYEKSLDDRVNNGATLRKNIDTTIQAARQAQMGGGAEAYTKLGSALQAIGVNTPTVDKWANGSLAASQVVDKVALQNSMSQLKQQLTGVGGSRLNAQEFVAYLNKNPNLTTDPRAAAEIFQLWNQFYDRDKTEQKMYNNFKSGKPTGDTALDHAAFQGNDLSGKPDIKNWPALWNQSDYMTKFAPGGHIDTSGVKGLAPPKDISDIMKKYGH